MLGLLGAVTGALSGAGIPGALIGAAALATHGVSRSTFDVDLLVTDPRVLSPGFWASLAAGGVAVDVRVGDPDDPLAGVVRLSLPAMRDVDVVVGRHGWQSELLGRARPITVEGLAVPVVTAPDLVLLKLYAGGPQDAWDVSQLLAAGEREAIAAAVEPLLARLPAEATALWRRVLGGP